MAVTSSRLILGLGLALALAGCGDDDEAPVTLPEGPGTVVVESEFLVPFGDACHVQGTVLNTTENITFDVSLRFQSLDATDKITGSTRANVNNLLPGERRLVQRDRLRGQRDRPHPLPGHQPLPAHPDPHHPGLTRTAGQRERCGPIVCAP